MHMVLCIMVVTMYVDKCKTTTSSGKSYTRYLLRESYRQGKKVKNRTLMNLTPFGEEACEAIRLAMKHKGRLKQLLADAGTKPEIRQGPSFAAVWLLAQVARKLGITKTLGDNRQGKLALWQVLARTISQGSRLSAVRLAGSHAVGEVLGLDRFDEDDLYENLDWLCENQTAIEKRLYKKRHGEKPCRLFLYDVTSSYFEGEQNELAAFGYNRDGKRGKRQVVLGLLCDDQGVPVAVEVFKGNTQDPTTFASQVQKATSAFQVSDVVFVGDRGMIKSTQRDTLGDHGFHYITAITKPQIETLLKQGQIQLTFFDEDLFETTLDDGTRCVLRRNPIRADELAASRRDKRASVARLLEKQNEYLAGHARASVEVAARKVAEKIEKLRIGGWLRAEASGRTLQLVEDAAALAEASRLDGCYCLITDLPAEQAGKETVHSRYKDLAQVEHAFRTMKTGHLELRPIYVRLASRTRGHALVVMLSYMLHQHLAECWRALDVTVEEGLAELSSLCTATIVFRGTTIQEIPRPRRSVAALLRAAGVSLPTLFPHAEGRVHTKTKLPRNRKSP